MFDNFKERFNKKKVEPQNDDKKVNKNKDEAKERLHLVLLQDRANVSADFLEMMRTEIIDVIKKYVDVNEDEIDVKLTNQPKADGTNGAPALYANIPIKSIKSEARKLTNAKVLSGEVKASDNKIADQKVKAALEDDNLFICLKTGQGSDVPALRADDLMKLVNSEQLFEITRVRFLDETLNEM